MGPHLMLLMRCDLQLHGDNCQGDSSHVYNLQIMGNKEELEIYRSNATSHWTTQKWCQTWRWLHCQTPHHTTLVIRAWLSGKSSLGQTLVRKTKSGAMKGLQEELSTPGGRKRSGILLTKPPGQHMLELAANCATSPKTVRVSKNCETRL